MIEFMESLSKLRPKQERLHIQSESLHTPVEIPDGFTNDAKHQTAERVLEQVRNGVDRWLLEKPLYLYLTQRVSEDELHTIESSFGRDAKEKYYANLRKVAREASTDGLTVNNDVAWFSLYDNNPSARKKERLARLDKIKS